LIGVITAAGKSSRMSEFKPLIRICGKYLIEYPLQKLIESFGRTINQIIVVVSDDSVRDVLGDVYEFGSNAVELIYVTQVKPVGIADAVRLAINKMKEMEQVEPIFVTFADIVCSFKFEVENNLSHFGVMPVEDKSLICASYGITEDGVVVEKPKQTENLKPLLGLGVYYFEVNTFPYFFGAKCSSTTGEVEITDVIAELYRFKAIVAREYVGEYWNLNSHDDIKKMIGVNL